MRTLEQIACQYYSEHTSKDVDVLRAVQLETLNDIKERLLNIGLNELTVECVVQSFVDENIR